MSHSDPGASEDEAEEAAPRRGSPRVIADGGTPSDDGESADGEPTDGAAVSDGHNASTAESGAAEGDGISRRAMLGYSGGSALATWALAGAGWYVFIHEPLEPEEEVVREYFNAIDRDHYNTAASLFHEDSPDSLWVAGRVAEVSQMDISVEDTEIPERWEDADRESVEEYALVVADVEMDSGRQSETFAIGIMVAKNTDGEWRIWRDEEEEASAALG